MALKTKITKEEFAALPAGVREAYIPDGEGYKIDISGYVVDDDPTALLNAKNHEKALRQEAERQLAEYKKQLADEAEKLRLAKEEAELAKLRKSGDFEALTKSFEAKLQKLEADRIEKENRMKEAIARKEIESQALKIASDIAIDKNAATILLPHIKSRLGVDLSGDLPKIQVLDAEGKPSAETFEDLQKGFIANPAFGAIITGTKAKGASGSVGGGTKVSTAGKKLADLSDRELIELRKENRPEYDRLIKESNSTST